MCFWLDLKFRCPSFGRLMHTMNDRPFGSADISQTKNRSTHFDRLIFFLYNDEGKIESHWIETFLIAIYLAPHQCAPTTFAVVSDRPIRTCFYIRKQINMQTLLSRMRLRPTWKCWPKDANSWRRRCCRPIHSYISYYYFSKIISSNWIFARRPENVAKCFVW